jgi:hypothetical protein
MCMRTAVLTIILLVASLQLSGQPGNPSGDPDVPIGGIEILLAAGGLLGLRKIFIIRRNQKKNE